MFGFLKKLFAGSGKASAVRLSGDGGMRDLEGFVEYVVRSLVDAPSEVRVSTEEKDDTSVIRIDCRKEDIGKIVGKRGKTIMAIRSLVRGAAGRMHKMVTVEVAD